MNSLKKYNSKIRDYMKVLFYNWAPLTANNKGGGVAVYLKNVLHYLNENYEKHHIKAYVITAGYYYDNENTPYLREEQNYEGAEVYSIINSPVIAPSMYSVTCINEILNDESTVRIFDDFIKAKGPFDVIHFESLEGISPNVLSLKKKYPDVKFIHSVHDYGIICPSVRLWTNDNVNCFKAFKGRNCCKCMSHFVSYNCKDFTSLRPAKTNDTEKAMEIKSFGDRIFRLLRRKIVTLSSHKKKQLEKWKNKNIDLINQFVDVEICVSQRVAEIVNQMGIKKEKIVVDYIGSKVAENAIYYNRTDAYTPEFTILYMGYAKIEKGFYFLIDALKKLDNPSNVILKVASKIQNKSDRDLLNDLKSKFKDVIVYDGYSHADFPRIMENVNLGVVSPLWEDNLPQVTIEMIANGIPVITSSNGGAHELNSHEDFVFTDENDFINKLSKIIINRNLLNEYWKNSKKLTTMEIHMHNLLKEYKK